MTYRPVTPGSDFTRRHLPMGRPQVEPEDIPVLARNFDGVDDEIRVPVTASNLTAPYTLAALCRVTKLDASVAQIQVAVNFTSGGSSTVGLSVFGTPTFTFAEYQSGATASQVVQPGKWVIMALSKATGIVAIDFSLYQDGAWNQAAGSGAINATATPNGTIRFGTDGSGAFSQIDLAVVAEWRGVKLTNTQVQELSANWRTSDWYNNSGGNPSALWEFNQDDVTTPVEDIAGHDQDESSRTGTRPTSTGPAGWVYGGIDVEYPYLTQRALVPA